MGSDGAFSQIQIPFRTELFAMQDTEYQSFQSKLIPNIGSELIIGVRIPQLRAFAKGISDTPLAKKFMTQLPHTYYDENNLHAMLIACIPDYDETIRALDSFLPYVDNWATCDLMRPKVFQCNKDKLLDKINEWLHSEHVYTRRFALEMLMVHYLDKDFQSEYLEMAVEVNDDDYYLRMMVAWFFATALAKQYDSTIHYIENCRLSVWIHNKTIQKALESYRLSEEVKAYLRKLKRQ